MAGLVGTSFYFTEGNRKDEEGCIMNFAILALVLNIVAMIVSIMVESWFSAGTNILVIAALVWWIWAERKKVVEEVDSKMYNGQNQQG